MGAGRELSSKKEKVGLDRVGVTGYFKRILGGRDDERERNEERML